MGYIEESLRKKSLPIHIIVFLMAMAGFFSCKRLFSANLVNFVYFLIPVGFLISFFYSEKTDITKNVVTAATFITLIIAVAGIFMAKSAAIINLVMCLVWILVFLSFALNKARDYFLMMYVSSITIISSIAMELNVKTIELFCIGAAIFCWIAFLRIGFVRGKMDTNQQFILTDNKQFSVINQFKTIIMILALILTITFPIYRVFPHAHVIIPPLINIIPKVYNWDLIDIPRFSPYSMQARSRIKYTTEETKKGRSPHMKLNKKARSGLVDIQREKQKIQFYHGEEEDLLESEVVGRKSKASEKEQLKFEKEKLDRFLQDALNELKGQQQMSPRELKELEEKLKTMQEEFLSKERLTIPDKKLNETIAKIINELKVQYKISRQRLNNLKEQLNSINNAINETTSVNNEFSSARQNLTDKEESLSQVITHTLSTLKQQEGISNQQLNNLKEKLTTLQNGIDNLTLLGNKLQTHQQNLTSQEQSLSQTITQILYNLNENQQIIKQEIN
ncbi:MAG: hypothetical protein FJZ16_06060, partial [Candidatus Omnitrophica bacterium]|nr:hypothetical protein [Candidatus Omnitrophota bacterium]